MSLMHRITLGAAALLLQHLPAHAAPEITSGKILTPSINVAIPPAAPEVMVHISSPANSVTFTWTGPSGQTLNSWFVGGNWGGPTLFQAYNAATPSTGFQLAFNLFTQPGGWTLSSVQVCSMTVQCSYYSGQPLKALFGDLSLHIANSGIYDITPPVVVGANLKTPVISLATNPNLTIELKATDDVSGVYSVFVQANTPGTFFPISVSSPQLSYIPKSKLFTMTTPLQPGTAIGTYTISTIFVQDFAGNITDITDPERISKVFGGQTQIKVTK
jgi:hypothetical protein